MTTTTKTRPAKKADAKPKRKPAKQDAKFLPVADLHVSKLNMRHGKTAPDIGDIYPSILERGVHQSLLVRKEGKGYGCLLYTSPSPRDQRGSRMPSSA